MNRIPVSFEKSHIITLGKKMYSKSIDLIRELVNNAYDADATIVRINLTSSKIIVDDDGSGMDLNGLMQYFNIGSREKAIKNISPKYKRKRIGELGIGKFSSLSASSKFEIITRKDDFCGKVVFDQNEWDKSESDWSVPLTCDQSYKDSNGTIVTLYNVGQQFTPQEVTERLRTSVPLDENNFRVFVNENEVKTIFINGKRIKVEKKTQYGDICGQIIIADKPQRLEYSGIECKVKNVMISKSLFGYEGSGHGINRITGFVNADFLPFNSARDNFLVNTDEYRVFYHGMKEELAKIVRILKIQEDDNLLKQSSDALKKASQLIDKAFRSLPELTPVMNIHVTTGHKDTQSSPDVESGIWKNIRDKTGSQHHKAGYPRKEYKIPHVNPVTENKVLKKIRTDFGIKHGFVNEGCDGAASYFMDDTIWVNREHKLYQHNMRTIDQEITHLVRILISEAVILTKPADLRQAYEREIMLLSAAYVPGR